MLSMSLPVVLCPPGGKAAAGAVSPCVGAACNAGPVLACCCGWYTSLAVVYSSRTCNRDKLGKDAQHSCQSRASQLQSTLQAILARCLQQASAASQLTAQSRQGSTVKYSPCLIHWRSLAIVGCEEVKAALGQQRSQSLEWPAQGDSSHRQQLAGRSYGVKCLLGLYGRVCCAGAGAGSTLRGHQGPRGQGPSRSVRQGSEISLLLTIFWSGQVSRCTRAAKWGRCQQADSTLRMAWIDLCSMARASHSRWPCTAAKCKLRGPLSEGYAKHARNMCDCSGS